MKQNPPPSGQLNIAITAPPEPLGDFVLLELVSEYEGQEISITLPDSVQEKSRHAVVRAVGEGRPTEFGATVKPTCKVGQKVFFNPSQALRLDIDGRIFLLIQQHHIMAVFPARGKVETVQTLQKLGLS